MKSILSVDQFEKWDAMKSKQEKEGHKNEYRKRNAEIKTILFSKLLAHF
jgi:hypothetical protein